jgi:hypothetical protein
MRDGRRASFAVGSIDAGAIIARDGAQTRYELNDIETMEWRQFSGVKTGFLVGGIVAGALFFAVAAAYASLVGGLT